MHLPPVHRQGSSVRPCLGGVTAAVAKDHVVSVVVHVGV